MITEKSKELALQYAEILETRCKYLCEKYSITPDQLIIKMFINNEIRIDIKGVHFKIENEFTIGE